MCWSILYKLKGKINPFDMYYAIASEKSYKKAKCNTQKGRTSTYAKNDGYFCHIQHKTQ